MKKTVMAAVLGASLVFAGDPPPGPAETAGPSKRERAHALLLQGKAAEASALYAEEIAAVPADSEAMAGRVRALIAADEWRKAIDEAMGYAERDGSADVRAALGEARFRAGRLREAEETVDALVREEHPPARALMVAGLLRAARGNDDEAATLLGRAVDAAPRDRSVLYAAAGSASTRARTVELLQRYLEVSEGDDVDRIEGAKGTLDLYRALGERPIWVPDNRPERLELPLRILASRPGAADGHVVDVILAGRKKVPLLLDSGSTGLFLVDRIARRAEFDPLSSETVFGGGGEGRTTSQRGLLSSFAIGELSFRDALATSSKHEVDATGRFQGVLGLWLFDGYRITLDLRRGRLVLDRAGTGAAGEPYWKVGGQMLVEAQATDGQKGLFLFDTGATTTLLSRSLADASARAKIGGPATVRGYGGALRGGVEVRGLSVGFLGLSPPSSTLNAADLTMRSRLGGVEISGFLGLDLLSESIVVVDTRAQRISVSKPEK
jgi:tetratricopeptide (TPR) repeat protein